MSRFYARDAITPRSIPFTFAVDGFYKKFKKRVQIALKDVDFQNPSRSSNLMTDTLLLGTLISSMIAAGTNSWLAFIISGKLGIYALPIEDYVRNFANNRQSVK